MLGSINKKIIATALSLTVIISSLSVFALNYDKFSIQSSALEASWCDAFGETNSLTCPYADFSPFVNKEQDVYEISTPEQLAAFSFLSNSMPDPRITLQDSERPRFKVNPYDSNSTTVEPTFFTGKTIKLVEDIDLSGRSFMTIAGTELTLFNGTFDGNNKTISNINIGTKINIDNQERELISKHVGLGLFGTVRGDIKDLNIENINISDDCIHIGGIAAVLEGNISNVSLLNSKIEANHADHVGGIVGKLAGNISNVSVSNTTINVNNAIDVGGIIGCTDKENSYDYGQSAPEEYNVPEFVRINKISDTNVQNIKINANAKNIGGVAGNLHVLSSNEKIAFLQLFNSSVKKTDINSEGSSNVGGICGYLSNCHVQNCINDHISNIKHSVAGPSNIGGIVGYINDCEIWNKVSNYLDIEVNNKANISQVNVGGVIGKAYKTILNECTNFTIISGRVDAAFVGGIIGLGKELEILNCSNEPFLIKTLNAHTGGIIGGSFSTKIVECYNRSNIEVEKTKENIAPKSGALFGIYGPNSTLKSCYYDRAVSAIGAKTNIDIFLDN